MRRDAQTSVRGAGGIVARLRAEAAQARRIADALAETLDGGAAVAVFASPAGWTVEIHGARAGEEPALRALLESCAGAAAAAELEFEPLAERDWVAASLAGLAPVRAGRFVIHGGHDRARVPANAVGVEIEAALAFGTGHHGTTRGCLLALHRLLKGRRPRRVLDLGTGSGVLAIAAAQGSCAAVLASDIDAQALRAARGNARLNGVGGAIAFVRAAGVASERVRRRGRYDLVLANILLRPLLRLARPLARLTAADARVVLSGILPAQANAIVAAYRAQGLRLERRFDLDGWTTLVLARGRR
jgi:ribosomal protein L11 methyltransferase